MPELAAGRKSGPDAHRLRAASEAAEERVVCRLNNGRLWIGAVSKIGRQI